MRLNNEVAVITGAGSGIGRSVAVRFAEQGASLILCGRTPATLAETKDLCAGTPATFAETKDLCESTSATLAETRELCSRAGARVLTAPLDVRDEAALAEVFARGERDLGTIRIAVASHGINALAPVESMDLAVWNEVVSINLTGTFLLARAATRCMRPHGSGRIILISSVSGRPGYEKFPGFAAYCASKYGLTGLTEVLAAELSGSEVSVAVLCPSGVETAMFRKTFPGARAEIGLDRITATILDLADLAIPMRSGSIIDLV